MSEPYLTDERLMIQEVARDFTMNEVLPVANELDPVQGEIPMELRRKMGELGYFGIRTPEEYGGLGLGVFEYCLIAEELARGWMSVASIIARAGGVMGVGGWSKEKRIELTRKAAQGEYLAAWRLLQDGAKFVVIALRMIVLFSPMRVFLPASVLMFVAGASYGAYTIYQETDVTDSTVLLITMSVVTFLVGLVSEQIALMRLERLQK